MVSKHRSKIRETQTCFLFKLLKTKEKEKILDAATGKKTTENTEDTNLWIGYCAFHLGDYKRALEVSLKKLFFL